MKEKKKEKSKRKKTYLCLQGCNGVHHERCGLQDFFSRGRGRAKRRGEDGRGEEGEGRGRLM
jgi:hypothetical protein